MKIYLNKANENWIVDRQRKEWYEYNPETLPSSVDDLDLVWIIAPWVWRHISTQLLKIKKVVCTIHHVIPSKFEENDFILRDRFVHCYHVFTEETKNFIQKFTEKPIVKINAWYDPNLWFRDGKTYYQDFGLDEGDYIVGSFQRDTEGSDLISPKLCKGPDLFCDYVEKLYKQKPNLKVLLGGYRRQYVINRLTKSCVPYVYREMCDEETLRRMYQACDLYVVSSRTEGGPQAIFEASAVKTPIISTDCGQARDVLCSDCIVNIENEFYTPTRKNIDYNYKNIQKFSILNINQKYKNLFEEVCS